jgi:signal transduction histidine kinase
VGVGKRIVQKDASGDVGHGSDREFPIIVATTPISASQRRTALAVIILLFIAAVIEAPFARIQLPRVDAFIPTLQTVICVADLITAILLFAQYWVQPRPAILVLAGGYIASGLFSFLQTLAFPGAYAPSGLIGDGIDSPAWLFVWWHFIFPAAILTYALLKNRQPLRGSSARSTGVMIGITVACALALVAGLTWVATSAAAYLPSLYTGVTQQTRVTNNMNLFLWLWSATAFVVVFARRRTILDLWLMVTLFAWMPHLLNAIVVTTYRFTVGWYSARLFALAASCTVLAVLLTETIVLYARLANAVTMLRRERANRLMSLDAATAAMAHELRQPLTGVLTAGQAGLNWLKRTPPDIEKVRSSLASVIEGGNRAADTITSVRDLFKHRADHRAMIRVDDTVRQALSLIQPDLDVNEVSVATEFQNNMPEIYADRTQLQQVILNLVRNAIDAMSSIPRGARRLRLTASLSDSSSILLSVQDSGPGITTENSKRVFVPFFTTKPAGMGLGLAMCQAIVEDHGGNLRLAKTDSAGCVFEIALPVDVVAESPSDTSRTWG